MRRRRVTPLTGVLSPEKAEAFLQSARTILFPTNEDTPRGKGLMADRRAVIALDREMQADRRDVVEIAAAVRLLLADLGRLQMVDAFVAKPRKQRAS
jgi:hypothetical protein